MQQDHESKSDDISQSGVNELVDESALNDEVSSKDNFEAPSADRSESADRRRTRSIRRADSQQRREKPVPSPVTRRGNSNDRRHIKRKGVKNLNKSRGDIPRYTRQELLAARAMENEWNEVMKGSGDTGEEREGLGLGEVVPRSMSRKKMRKLMRHRRVSPPNKEEQSVDDIQYASPRCDHDAQSVDLDQPAAVDGWNNNSDDREAAKQNPRRKESRMPLLKRIWQSMCCSSDQGHGSTVDSFIGSRKIFRLKSKGKTVPSLTHDEVPSWKLLRKYRSARNQMVDNLSSLDYNGLVKEYQTLLSTDSMNDEVTHTMENVHEIVQNDDEYEAYCKRFQADQEALMRKYARTRAERERQRLRAEISNAAISRETYQRQIDETCERITELTILLNGVQDVKDKRREGANKSRNAKSSRNGGLGDEAPVVRFDGSEPLPAGIMETEETPFPNLSVLLKGIERKAMVEREERFRKRAEIEERLRLAEENGGVLPPREVEQKKEFVKRKKRRPDDRSQTERKLSSRENVECQTPVLVIEHVTHVQQKESERKAECKQKRAVAFVIDMGNDDDEKKSKKLPPKRFAQRLQVAEEDSVKKVQRAVAFVVDMGDGDCELDVRRAKKMTSLISKKMSNQVCSDSKSFEVRFSPGTKQGNKALAYHGARGPPPTNRTMDNTRNSLNRNQQHSNQKIQTSKWRTHRTQELASKQRAKRAKLLSNRNASSIKTSLKYSTIKSAISTFRNDKNIDTKKYKCYTAWKASNVETNNMETKPEIVKQKKRPIAKYASVKSAISTFRNKNDTYKSKCYTAWKASNVERNKMETKSEIVKQKKQPFAKYASVKSAISTFRNKNDTNKSKCYTAWKASIVEANNMKTKPELVKQKKQTIAKYATVKSVISTFRNVKKVNSNTKESRHTTETEKQPFSKNKRNMCDKTQAKYAQVQEFARMSRMCKETTVSKYRSHPMHATMKSRMPKPCATVIGAASRFADRFINSVKVPGRVAPRKDYWREKFVEKPWECNVVCDIPKSYQRPRAKKASKIPLTSSIMANKNKYHLKPEVCKPQQTKSPYTMKRPDSVRDQIGDNLHHEGQITPRCFSPYSALPPITPRGEVKSGLKVNTPTKEKRPPKMKELKNGSKCGEPVTSSVIAKSSFDGISPLPPIKTSRSVTNRSVTSCTATSRSATTRSATSRSATSHSATNRTATSRSATSHTATSRYATSRTATSHSATSRTTTSRSATSHSAKNRTATSRSATSRSATNRITTSRSATSHSATNRTTTSRSATSHSATNRTTTSRSATSHSATNRTTTSHSATGRSVTSSSTPSRKSTPHVTHRGNAQSPLDVTKPLPPIRDGTKTGVNDVTAGNSTSFCKESTSFMDSNAAKKQALRVSVGSPSQSCRDAGHQDNTPTRTQSRASNSANMKDSPNSKHPPKELPPLRHTPKMMKPNADKPRMPKSPEINRKPTQLSPLRHTPVYKDKPAVKPDVKKVSKSKRNPKQLAPLRHSPVVEPDGSPIPVGHYSHNFDVTNDVVGFKSKFQIPRTPASKYGR